jgi:hypothetical protein
MVVTIGAAFGFCGCGGAVEQMVTTGGARVAIQEAEAESAVQQSRFSSVDMLSSAVFEREGQRVLFCVELGGILLFGGNDWKHVIEGLKTSLIHHK